MTSPPTTTETGACLSIAEVAPIDTPGRIRSVLLLGGSLSGATGSLMNELRARGLVVHRDRPSLRRLPLRPFFLAIIALEAFFTYGLQFRRYLLRTRASSWAFGFASERAVSTYEQVDMVVHIGANHAPFSIRRRPDAVYAVYTDHCNLLSKKLPAFGLHTPERYVSTLWNRIERRILALQDHVFVMGSHVKRSMIDDYGLPPARVSAVGAGPNLDIDIERDGFRKDPQAKNILFVGLEPERKGLPALRKAFALLRKVHPDATLHVAGVQGESADGVVFHGKLYGDALKQLFYKAQVFAMPSLREPFGMVFIEAMWAKAVCLGTNVGAIPEIISDGRTGFVVEPNDVDALADRMTRLFDEPELRTAFAEQAYAEARRKWSWPHVATQILSVANRLLRARIRSKSAR